MIYRFWGEAAKLGPAWEERERLRSGFVVFGEENPSEAAPGHVVEGDLKPRLYFHSCFGSFFHLTQHRCE